MLVNFCQERLHRRLCEMRVSRQEYERAMELYETLVDGSFDERDDAIVEMCEMHIVTERWYQCPCGVCSREKMVELAEWPASTSE